MKRERQQGGMKWAWRGCAAAALIGLAVMTPAPVTQAADAADAYYDCRSVGKAPVIKSQGTTGTCWAIAATSALEAAGMPETDVVYAADHMSLANGFQITQDEGGDYKMIMAYLSGWYGPVLEEDDPYGDGVTDETLQAAAHVQEILLMDSWSQDAFKETILSAGPVQTSMVMNRQMTDQSDLYYNEESFGFYDPEEGTPDHDILILGWDDAYSKESFAQQPSEDGAWICQNSWGEDFGDAGIFYISYEDANIARTGLAYTVVEPTDNYSRIYQTDTCGWQGKIGYEKSYCYFANVFEAQEKEYLRAAGFYSTGTQTSYEIYLVENYEDTDSFSDKQLLTEGTISAKGYFTIQLPEPVLLTQGERFALVVDIDTAESSRPVAVEIEKDSYTAGVTLENKEGYISLYGGAWEQVETVYGANVCLKAYTG